MGSGQRSDECCRECERSALQRFGDSSLLGHLRVSMEAYARSGESWSPPRHDYYQCGPHEALPDFEDWYWRAEAP